MQVVRDSGQVTCEEQVCLSDRFLTVSDQRFHYIWLRDHCLCPQCHHASSFQKIYDISDRLEPPKPKSASVEDDQLIIEWDENPVHRSVFPLSWLLSYAYDGPGDENGPLPQPTLPPPNDKILWDRAWLEAHPQQWPQFGSCPFESWIDQLDTLGFTIVRNLPWAELDAFISEIGPIYPLAQYGRYATVKAIPNGQDLSLSDAGDALPPHTDLSFIPAPRVVQLLYCVENQASGGESLLVDGYRVARDFRADHPHYFRILSETPVQFRQFYQQWDYFVSRTTPILQLDAQGDVTDIYFSHKNFGLALPFEQVEGFYDAYCEFARYLKNPVYQYWFRMQPGDCQIIQNFRVLHGRNAFVSSSGPRHLEIAYMEWMYYAGRRDFDLVKPLYEATIIKEYNG